MFKRYKTVDGRLFYNEAWIDEDNSVVVHEGQVGHRGNSRLLTCANADMAERLIKRREQDAIADGYELFTQHDYVPMTVELPVDGNGDEDDLDRCQELEDYLDQFLGWMGLGGVDNGSIRSGKAEVNCLVVNYKLAATLTAADLAKSEFSDVTRIYQPT